MMELNKNGDLVKSPGIEAIEFGFLQTPGMVIATATELKAALAANGKVVISREDACRLLNWYAIFRAYEHKDMVDIELEKRIRTALKENSDER